MAGCSGDGPSDDPSNTDPVFSTDVAPILAENCVGCHQAGSIAPFQLETFEQVQANAALIRDAVVNRRMPPFLVDDSGECNSYKDSRWLTTGEIETISRWVDQGTQPGPDIALPEPVPLRELDEVDAILQASEPYQPNTALTDDYRCFVVDPGLASDQYVIGFEAVPGQPTQVHHIILYQPTSDEEAAAAVAKDLADTTGPGYTCFGSPGVDSLHVAGWAPGALAAYYPEGTGIKLPAGRKMVMQVHYNLLGGSEPDQSVMRLDLASSVQEELLVVPLADTDLALAPGEDSVSTSISIPVPAQIPTLPMYGVFPHMHQLGTSLKVTRLRDGVETCIVDVPRWDFDWQLSYQWMEPLDLKGGDILQLTCEYDTSGRSDVVYWGDGTKDEMCLNYIMLGVPPGLIP